MFPNFSTVASVWKVDFRIVYNENIPELVEPHVEYRIVTRLLWSVKAMYITRFEKALLHSKPEHYFKRLSHHAQAKRADTCRLSKTISQTSAS